MFKQLARLLLAVLFTASAMFVEGGVVTAMQRDPEQDVSIHTSLGTREGTCWLDARAALRINAALREEQTVEITFDDRCRPIVTRTRRAASPSDRATGRLAAPLSASTFRGCRSDNRMFDDLGGADFERLRTILEFYFDGTSVTSFVRHTATSYSAPGSPYTTESPFLWISQTATPAFNVRAWYEARYWWWWSYDGEKENDSYGYCDGYCYTDFTHWGNVCRTCRVLFYLYPY